MATGETLVEISLTVIFTFTALDVATKALIMTQHYYTRAQIATHPSHKTTFPAHTATSILTQKRNAKSTSALSVDIPRANNALSVVQSQPTPQTSACAEPMQTSTGTASETTSARKPTS